MPPTLDLSGATHTKMMVAPPRINLRRAASYQGDRGPLSSSSSRFSFNHLVFASPPPSPRLPTLVPPRPRKASNPPRPSRILKTAFCALASFLAIYFTISTLRHSNVPWLELETDRYEMVGQDVLPDFPTPFVFTDRRGNPKWTVSIPHAQPFPLSLKAYSDMAGACREVALRVEDMRHPGRPATHDPSRITSGNAQFIDVRQAEDAGLLPQSPPERKHFGGLTVCSSSLTFVLESSDAGIGKTLMMLWTAYGLAQRQGRAFFVDDSRWAYGKWVEMFEPVPAPNCRPARPHERLPCPFQARHLVVNFATAEGYFASALGGNSGGHMLPDDEMSHDDLERRGVRFDLARKGFEVLFRPTRSDADYVTRRVAELRGRTRAAPADGPHDGIVVGLHVRRGDRHPVEYMYRGSYIPLSAYAEQARQVLEERDTGKSSIKGRSLTVVASDDPTVYEAEELSGAAHAQEQIKLASKSAIQRATEHDRSIMRKFVDDTFGWEGGFFAAMFWNLGQPDTRGQQQQQVMITPSDDTTRLRTYMGRAYTMDLAVLSGASDVVVCTVSAMGCRLLAVMMGRERAFSEKAWVNIDGGYGWDGQTW